MYYPSHVLYNFYKLQKIFEKRNVMTISIPLNAFISCITSYFFAISLFIMVGRSRILIFYGFLYQQKSIFQRSFSVNIHFIQKFNPFSWFKLGKGMILCIPFKFSLYAQYQLQSYEINIGLHVRLISEYNYYKWNILEL